MNLEEKLNKTRLISLEKEFKDVKIVCIGGGTGMSSLLKGLKNIFPKLTAITTSSDNGRSTGILTDYTKLPREAIPRDEKGKVLPMGDTRQAIYALIPDTIDPLEKELFNYRFKKGVLKDHTVGNIEIAAAFEMMGNDFQEAINFCRKKFNISQKIYPCTLERVTLNAIREDGKLFHGEEAVENSRKVKPRDYKKYLPDIKKVFLSYYGRKTQSDNKKIKANPLAVEAIKKADLITIGPGSLYTSISAILLVPGIAKAIREFKGPKIYFTNLVTQNGETNGYKASDHFKKIVEILKEDDLDGYCVVVNTGKPSKQIIENYRRESKEIVEPDVENIPVISLAQNYLASSERLRYNSDKLADTVCKVLRMFR